MTFNEMCKQGEITIEDILCDFIHLAGSELYMDYSTEVYKETADRLDKEAKEKGTEGPTFEGVLATMFNEGATFTFIDRENGEETNLTKDMLDKGVEALYRDAPESFENLSTGNEDALDSYNFIQCCLFGEVIYG